MKYYLVVYYTCTCDFLFQNEVSYVSNYHDLQSLLKNLLSTVSVSAIYRNYLNRKITKMIYTEYSIFSCQSETFIKIFIKEG